MEEMLGKRISNLITQWNEWDRFRSNPQPLFYRSFSIRKGTKVRRIKHPIPSLMKLQRKILSILDEIILPTYVQGFVSGRSVKTHAEFHRSQAIVLSFDIKNFFESTTIEHITRSLGRFIDSPEAIQNIATVCTSAGQLPQGAPTSPVLANISFLDIDEKLDNLAKNNSGVYSRYADDLIISSSDRGIYDLIRYVELLVEDGKYRINKDKTRYASRKRQQIVTGLVVNETIQPSSKVRYNFKAKIHQLARSQRPISRSMHASIKGMYNWIEKFNPNFANNQLNKHMLRLNR